MLPAPHFPLEKSLIPERLFCRLNGPHGEGSALCDGTHGGIASSGLRILEGTYADVGSEFGSSQPDSLPGDRNETMGETFAEGTEDSLLLFLSSHPSIPRLQVM